MQREETIRLGENLKIKESFKFFISNTRVGSAAGSEIESLYESAAKDLFV